MQVVCDFGYCGNGMRREIGRKLLHYCVHCTTGFGWRANRGLNQSVIRQIIILQPLSGCSLRHTLQEGVSFITELFIDYWRIGKGFSVRKNVSC